MSSKFKIGDIVEIDYGVDFVSGFIAKVYSYDNFGIKEYYYDVVDFFDGGTDKHINEQWLSCVEDHLKPSQKLLDTKCNTG
jgi:methionine aminopeptidase